MKCTAVLLLLVSLSVPAFAQRRIQISSPDGNLVFNFGLNDQKPSYSVNFKGKPVIASSTLSLSSQDGSLLSNVRLLKVEYREGVEDYTLTVGKNSKVREAYREVVIPLESKPKASRLNVVVRAFNDALAFRYEFLKTDQMDSLVLTDENTGFRIDPRSIVHGLRLPNYTSSHEGFYSKLSIQELKDGELIDMPVLCELPGNIFVAITEAALLDYAGMYLTRENGVLRSQLSPFPGQTRIKVKAALPHKSPWRVILISDRVGDLIESNILTNLNEPTKMTDISWIKPGKTTFPWWNGNVVPDTLNAPGNNFVTQQYYIDFCARSGLEYHTVVEYGLHQWYVDDGVGFQPGPNSDVTKPVPGLDMKQVCDYARSKGVGVRVWVQWAALYPKLDTAFALFEQWGLQGMMVDFMDRDDQEMVNIQTEMLEKAAAHHLHIQFHGAYKPTGLHRTFPNELTREGTLNYEINKWDEKGLPPDHDIMIPFTRMLAGSTDYHLGGFRAVPQEKYVRQYTRPLMLGTRCHMLAMYVILENYLGMVCDHPAAYEGEPGFDFIQKVPTVWDETRVLDARVGEYIIIARRKEKEWFIGAITNLSSRSLKIPVSFLSQGTYTATIYSDLKNADQPNQLTTHNQDVVPSDYITIQLAEGGGMAAILKPR